MKGPKKSGKAAMLALSLTFVATFTAKAGPPFQTDDPEPVDFHHYEFYAFGNADGTGVEMDTAGPAVEFNWGIIPEHSISYRSACGCHRALKHSEVLSLRCRAKRLWHGRH